MNNNIVAYLSNGTYAFDATLPISPRVGEFFESGGHITTIYESRKVRFVYYGDPTYSTGTIYTSLSDGTIHDAQMYHSTTIPRALEMKLSDWSVGAFWFLWIMVTGGIVIVFYYIDNKWLEDKGQLH